MLALVAPAYRNGASNRRHCVGNTWNVFVCKQVYLEKEVGYD